MASTSSSTSPDVQVLMGKGKRGAAAYISLATGRDTAGCPPYLNELLDVLLNPSKPIDDWEIIDWCKWLMAGGRTPNEFASTGGYFCNKRNGPVTAECMAHDEINIVKYFYYLIGIPIFAANTENL